MDILSGIFLRAERLLGQRTTWPLLRCILIYLQTILKALVNVWNKHMSVGRLTVFHNAHLWRSAITPTYFNLTHWKWHFKPQTTFDNTRVCLIYIFGPLLLFIIQPVYIWFVVTYKWPKNRKYWCIFDSCFIQEKHINFFIARKFKYKCCC